jgi:hypothetical protein
MLINLRKTPAHLLLGQAEQVDDHDTAGTEGKVAPIAILADVLFEPWAVAEPKMRCLVRGHDEAGAMQRNPSAGQACIGP